ncbi:hypothetical protein BAE44_0001707, partial [Dichanthelium oligosanthes]
GIVGVSFTAPDLSISRSSGTSACRLVDIYEKVKLIYVRRDRAVEMYFWGFGMFQGEGNSRARIMFSKITALITLMDDTYDAHGIFEDCEKFDQAIQR